jgi:hypothetical protein
MDPVPPLLPLPLELLLPLLVLAVALPGSPALYEPFGQKVTV